MNDFIRARGHRPSRAELVRRLELAEARLNLLIHQPNLLLRRQVAGGWQVLDCRLGLTPLPSAETPEQALDHALAYLKEKANRVEDNPPASTKEQNA